MVMMVAIDDVIGMKRVVKGILLNLYCRILAIPLFHET